MIVNVNHTDKLAAQHIQVSVWLNSWASEPSPGDTYIEPSQIIGWGPFNIHPRCTNCLECPSLRYSHGWLALDQHLPLLYQLPGMPFPEIHRWFVWSFWSQLECHLYRGFRDHLFLSSSFSTSLLSIPMPCFIFFMDILFSLWSFLFVFLIVSLSHQKVLSITAGPGLSHSSLAHVQNSTGIEQALSQYLYN